MHWTLGTQEVLWCGVNITWILKLRIDFELIYAEHWFCLVPAYYMNILCMIVGELVNAVSII